MTDIILAILSIVLLLAGLAGAVLPIPGPPLSLAGLFCLHYSKYANFDKRTLIVFTILTIAMSILDYYAPIWGTKKFGGTKFGAWGSTIGRLVFYSSHWYVYWSICRCIDRRVDRWHKL